MAALHPFGLVMGADPFRELRRIQAELSHISDFMAPAPVSGFPAVNLYAGQDGITVVAELPGVEKDELEVQVHQDTLTLRGARAPASEHLEAYHRHERRSGTFTRTIQLPYRIDPDRIEAQLENGVLWLSLPRPSEDKPRRIAVSG